VYLSAVLEQITGENIYGRVCLRVRLNCWGISKLCKCVRVHEESACVRACTRSATIYDECGPRVRYLSPYTGRLLGSAGIETKHEADHLTATLSLALEVYIDDTRVRVRACVCMCMWVCNMYIYIHLHIQKRTHSHTHTHTSTQTHIQTLICTYTRMCIRTCTH